MKKLVLGMLVVTSLFAGGKCDSFKILGPDWIDIKNGKAYTVNKFNMFLVKDSDYNVYYFDGHGDNSSCYTSKKNFTKLKDWQTK